MELGGILVIFLVASSEWIMDDHGHPDLLRSWLVVFERSEGVPKQAKCVGGSGSNIDNVNI